MTAQTPPTARPEALPRRTRGQALHDIQHTAPMPPGEADLDLIAVPTASDNSPKDPE
ncbi:hypothetical protein [Streptomyces sp. MI02-7b]|uniref:hypothetical protein n=1 Tax=Streptomyces sp. MI02-7b TaxID=462941 RepID=UPI0029A20D6A|nr:hypothetical protein [Streptomyces sp. MI02-7b]MDX3075830.1 hypothetical protein [Streptomyces sp. MI02-7b]